MGTPAVGDIDKITRHSVAPDGPVSNRDNPAIRKKIPQGIKDGTGMELLAATVLSSLHALCFCADHADGRGGIHGL